MLDPNYVKPEIPKYPPEQFNPKSCYPTMSSIVKVIDESRVTRLSNSFSLDELEKHYSEIYTKVLLTPFIAAAVTLIFTKYGTNILGGESSEIVRMSAKML